MADNKAKYRTEIQQVRITFLLSSGKPNKGVVSKNSGWREKLVMAAAPHAKTWGRDVTRCRYQVFAGLEPLQRLLTGRPYSIASNSTMARLYIRILYP